MQKSLLRNMGGSAMFLGIGLLAGIFLVPDVWSILVPSNSAEGDVAEDEHEGHDHEAEATNEISLTLSARRNLDLSLMPVAVTDYVEYVRIPGIVRELPGHSQAIVSSRVEGVISKVHAVPGQALRPNDRLFDVELTGDAIAATQSQLLDTIQQIKNLDEEIKRQAPVAERGGIAKKELIQLEYKQLRMDSQRKTQIQELEMHGLSITEVDQLMSTKKLIRNVTIRVPETFADNNSSENGNTSTLKQVSNVVEEKTIDWQYTLENLRVEVGQTVRESDPLCEVARHTMLYFEGQAYENEIEMVANVARRNAQLSVTLGLDGKRFFKDGLRIQYIDNEVDSESQAFRFYLPIKNEVLHDTKDNQGRVFRSWTFRPGQRGHVKVPIRPWKKKFQVPLEAIVREGPDAYVFKLSKTKSRYWWYAQEHHDGDLSKRDELNDWDLEQIPVVIVHEDVDHVVLAADGKLKANNVIAANNAYQLQLALKTKAGGGGGGNPHHGHNH